MEMEETAEAIGMLVIKSFGIKIQLTDRTQNSCLINTRLYFLNKARVLFYY